MNMRSYNCGKKETEEFKKIVSLSFLLKTIAEESRLKILCLIGRGKLCVCDIAEALDLSQSLVSHHLADLKKIGLVKDEKRGQRVYYQLTVLGREVISLLRDINIKHQKKKL